MQESPARLPSDATLLVGPGRVGSTLGLALHAAGWPLSAIASRAPEQAAALAGRLGHDVAAGTLASMRGPFPVVVLAVVDGAVGEQSARLVERGLVDGHSIVLHVSGIHASDVLAPAAAVGAATGSMHPLQTFPDADTGIRQLPGSHWFLEGAPRALDVASRIVSRLGGIDHVVSRGNKALYHASASMACNLFTALLDAALDTARTAGLDRADMMAALYPLVRSALDNALAQGTKASLTGPVSRADLETVRMHVDALADLGDLSPIYRVLALRSVAMAQDAGRLDEASASALRACLEEPASRARR